MLVQEAARLAIALHCPQTIVEILMLQPTPGGPVGSFAGAAHGLRREIDWVRFPAVDILEYGLASMVRHAKRYGMVRQSLRLDLGRMQPGGSRGAGYLLVDQFLTLQFHGEMCFF